MRESGAQNVTLVGPNESLETRRRIDNIIDTQPEISAFAVRSIFLNSYVEERVFIEYLRRSALLKTAFEDEEQLRIIERLGHNNLPLNNSLEDMYAHDTSYHVIGILRHIPLKILYSSLGWQTSEAGMRHSKERVKSFILRNSTATRKCLWHAASIFAKLRASQHWACIDPLSLCVAVHYLVAYDSSASHPEAGEILRLDRNDQEVIIWLEQGGQVNVHISGIGIMGGQQSISSIITAVINIYRCQCAWKPLSQGLAARFEHLLHGEKPLFAAK